MRMSKNDNDIWEYTGIRIDTKNLGCQFMGGGAMSEKMRGNGKIFNNW